MVGTKPPPGPIPPTTVVELLVSSGNVKVPNVIGLTCDQAKQKLDSSNLKGNCTDAPSDTAPQGQVFSQNPSAGARAYLSTARLLSHSHPPSRPRTAAMAGETAAR